MKILYVSNLYHPEPGALPERVSQLSRHWVEMGHEVTVLTGFPNHPYGKLYPGYRRKLFKLGTVEHDRGVKVIRTPYLFRPNRGGINRGLSFLSFAASAAVRSVFTSRYDVVIGTFPQPLQAISAWFKARINRSKFVLEVRDLWPETIVGTGLADERSATYNFVLKVVQFLYSRSDSCVTVTEAASEIVEQQYGVYASAIHCVPAGVFAERFDVDSTLNPESGHVTALYAGTTGNSQGLSTLVQAAKILESERPDIRIQLVGGGAEWDDLGAESHELNLSNIDFVGQVPRDKVPSYLANADIGLAILRDSPVFRTAVPTKIYEYMAAGLPIVSNVQGEARRLIENAGSGHVVQPGNPEELSKAISNLASAVDRRRVMSDAGRRYVTEHATWRARAAKYIDVLQELVGN